MCFMNNNAQYLDVLLIADNELNHSGTPFTHDNKNQAYQRFYRFVISLSTVDSHPSHKFDSMNSHPDLPLTLYLNRSVA